MESRLVRASVISLAFASFLPARAADAYAAWARSAELSLNTAPSGAGIASTLTGFPLLVRLTADNFDFAQARPDGGDLRFAKPDGTPLPYEIERWDPNLRAAEAWVRLDTLRGGDSSQSIRMYWGNGAAADSSRGAAVFSAANGYSAAWHLGGSGTAARPNAAGGNPAAPANYDGDEAATGVIARADSLDGGTAGDYLDLGDGYADLGGGMTFTVWAYPTSVKAWSHLLDLGNGENADNVIMGRWDTTAGFSFLNYSGANRAAANAPGQLALNQWQLLGATVSGKTVKLYKNGAEVLSDTLAYPIAGLARYLCFLGRSNAARGEYFQGKLDEAELSRTARGPDWMKLAYLNQKPAQSIPVVRKAPPCAVQFDVPNDTSAQGGSRLTLGAQADCASGIAWSVISGPSVRILDPEALELTLALPLLENDTDLILRFTAEFADSTRTGDVRVRVKGEPPEPVSLRPDGRGPDRNGFGGLPALRAGRDALGRSIPARGRRWTISPGP